LLAHGWWFSPGTLASFTTKTGGHDRAEILLKVTLNTIKSNQSTPYVYLSHPYGVESNLYKRPKQNCVHIM
jgi:hypothetical protein